jgi:ankyrin repeat protein
MEDEYGNHILFSLIERDDPEELRLFMEAGADVHVEQDNGWTPLHLAFDYAIDGMIQNARDMPYPEALEKIRLLIAYGADLSCTDNEGHTALDAFNTYAASEAGFNRLKDMFRTVVPDIDDKVIYTGKKDV